MSARREARKGGEALRAYPGDALLALLSALLLVLSFAHSVEAAPGDLDPTFGTGGKVITDVGTFGQAAAVAVQADGKLVVAGSSEDQDQTTGELSSRFVLLRYNANGTLDTSFGTGGRVITDFGGSPPSDTASALAIQRDGRIVVAGRSQRMIALARYNPVDGTLDTTFGSGGKVTTDFGEGVVGRANALAIDANGKLLVAGQHDPFVCPCNQDFLLLRYNANGALDTSFGNGGIVITDFGGSESASDLAIQRDGKLVVVGASERGPSQVALARYNADGTLDTSFGSGGKVLTNFGESGFLGSFASALAIDANGKLVVGGTFGADFALARYNADGTPDTTFGCSTPPCSGKVTTRFGGSEDFASALAIQRDGKLVLAGSAEVGSFGFALARYNDKGTLDTTFGSGGKVITHFGASGAFASALAIQADGRLVVAGSFGADFALARYEIGGLGVTAPAELGIAPDPTPGAPTGSLVWAPNPFQVEAFFTNPGPNAASGNLTLDLSSAGSQLSTLSPASVPFSNVGPAETVFAQWQVKAGAPGEAHYRVRASASVLTQELVREVVTRVPELVVPPVDNPLNEGPFPLVADGRFCRELDPSAEVITCAADFEGNVGGVPPAPFEWQDITPTGFKAGPTGAVPVLLNDPKLDTLVYAAVDTTANVVLDLYLMYDFLHRTTPFGPGENPTVEFEVKAGPFQTPPGSRMVVTFHCDQDTVVVDGFEKDVNGVPVPFSGRDGAALLIEGHCGFGPSPNASGDPSFDVRFNTDHARFELEVPLTRTLGGGANLSGVYDPSPAFWTAAAPGSGTLVLSQNTLSIDINTGGTTVTPLQPQATAPLVLRNGEMRLERDRDEDEHKDKHKDEREDRLSLRGSFIVPADSINPPAEGVTVTLVDGDGQIVEIRIPPGEGWKTSRGPEWVFKDKKNRSLADPRARETLSIKFNRERGRFDVLVNVKDTELTDPDAGPITTTLTIGDQAFVNTQAWRSKDRGRKLVTP